MSDPISNPTVDDPGMLGMHLGRVVDNEDPKGIGRVKLEIPGIIDESPWCRMLGTGHGFIPQRGTYNVPPIDAMVAVWFHLGDPESGYYLSGPPGSSHPTAGNEVPTLAKDQPTTAERHKIKVMETDFFVVAIDDRDAPRDSSGIPNLDTNQSDPRCRLLIQFKGDDDTPTEDDFIEIDGVTRGITVGATAGIRLQSLGIIELDANQIQMRVQGVTRRVGAVTKDI